MINNSKLIAYALDSHAYKNFVDNLGGDTATKLGTLKRIVNLIIAQELTDKQKVLINLTFVENKTQDEIAKTLGITQGTVSVGLTNAIKKIQKNIKYVSVALDVAERLKEVDC